MESVDTRDLKSLDHRSCQFDSGRGHQLETGKMIIDNPQTDKPYIQFICNPYEHSSSVNTRVTIDVMQKDLSRDEILQVFEDFIKACGYHLDPGESVCIERY